MKRTALWIGLALLAASVVLLLGPFGWLASRAPTAGAAPEPLAAQASADDPELSPAQARPEPPAASDPAPERRAVDATPEEGAAVFRLLDAEARPVGRARVLIARQDELLHDELSDENGEVSLPADGEPAQLVARAAGHPLELWPVRLEAGVHELRYPQRARVAGRLVLEGGAPAVGLRVLLGSDRPLLPADPVPQILWRHLGIEPSQAVVTSVESGQDGTFSLPGLPADWTGSLRLPRGWHIRSASHGQVQPSATSLDLEGPAEGLLLLVAAPATLRGRLLSASDSRPLDGVALFARLAAPDGGAGDNIGTSTDENGRFELVASGERIVGLELRLGTGGGESRLLLALEEAELPPDGDLGDVRVSDVRDVAFLLRAASGAPIRGGRARAAGLRSEPTDAEGRGVLRWLPLATPRLRAEADGFVPAEVELSGALPDPLVIVLVPASSLEVQVVPPTGGDPEQFRVILVREAGVAAAPVRSADDQRALVEAWSQPPVERWRADPATFLAGQPRGEAGLVLFRALQTGVPIELEVRGITGQAVYHRRTLEPFAPGETRRLEVALDDELLVFRGRVLDAEGGPLARATVQLGGQILGWTDEDGAFLCFLADAEPRTLVLQHQACSTLFLHDYVVPAGGREVEFRLQPARSVTIEVVDEAGQPLQAAEVWILQEGFITNTLRYKGSRHIASSLTDNPFEIEVRVGGRKYVQTHSSDVPEARVVVPVHGSVVAHVSAATTDVRAGHLNLILQPEQDADPGDPLVRGQRCEAGGLTLELSAVLPGRYQAWLTYDPTDDERAAGRQDESSAAVLVSVEPARRTEIDLDLP